MEIEQIKIIDLKPYKLNAKKHDEKQIEGLAQSIKQYGFLQPIVIDDDNNIIIGHGRIAGASLAGYTDLPCVKLKNLTQTQIRALRLIDNRIAETGWNNELLIEDLTTLDFNFADFNIDFDFINSNYTAGTEDDQGKLDEKQMTKCPKCGHVFDHAENKTTTKD